MSEMIDNERENAIEIVNDRAGNIASDPRRSNTLAQTYGITAVWKGGHGHHHTARKPAETAGQEGFSVEKIICRMTTLAAAIVTTTKMELWKSAILLQFQLGFCYSVRLVDSAMGEFSWLHGFS